MERKPPSHVLRISAVLLETERAVVANEDIDAMVACGIVEGRYDTSWHGGSHVTSNVMLSGAGRRPLELKLDPWRPRSCPNDTDAG